MMAAGATLTSGAGAVAATTPIASVARARHASIPSAAPAVCIDVSYRVLTDCDYQLISV